ncbi:MAG: UDP-glucuronic acid decarboxylase family protein [Balneolales bacterium]
MSKRVLITGGAGFLGSHLCERYLKEGYEVICMDNISTGRVENIEHLIGAGEFTFIKYNVTDYIHVPGKLDLILHFASPASPIDYLEMPIQTLKVGSLGTHKALGLAKSKNARFLLASTSEVYGDPLIHPQKEEHWGNVNPIGLRGVYDEAKRFAEALVMAYHRTHSVDSRIVRIFNTYGPRMRLDDGRALPTFIAQAIKREDLSIFGDGSQTRSFCYVDDLVEGIYRLSQSDYVYPVNIGNPEEISILDFAKEVLTVTGSTSKIAFKDLPEDDPKVRQPDTSKAQEILDWSAKVGRKEGLRRTYEFFQNMKEKDLMKS